MCVNVNTKTTGIRVYQDGKLGRGTKGKILKARNKSLFIVFFDYIEDKNVGLWFRKVRREGRGVYYNRCTNYWFYKSRETEKFKEYCRDTLTPEYYRSIFGD